jgi:hypothetical protein
VMRALHPNHAARDRPTVPDSTRTAATNSASETGIVENESPGDVAGLIGFERERYSNSRCQLS